MTNWKELITEALCDAGETWEDVVANTMSDSDMEVMFDDDFGCVKGCPFTVWTQKHVFFPHSYDGAEMVCFVSRNPDGKPTRHIGGS